MKAHFFPKQELLLEDYSSAFLARYKYLSARYPGDLTLHPPHTHIDCTKQWNTYAGETQACLELHNLLLLLLLVQTVMFQSKQSYLFNSGE